MLLLLTLHSLILILQNSFDFSNSRFVHLRFRSSRVGKLERWGEFLRLPLKARSTVANIVGPILHSPKTSSPRVNVTFGEKEERMMMTGAHVVADIFCVRCGSIVGWKYETAHEKSQKYKEGKSVLERFKISGPDGSTYWVSHGAQFGGSDGDDA